MLSITLNALHVLTCYQRKSSLENDPLSSYRGKKCHRHSKKLASGPNLRFDTANTWIQVLGFRIESEESNSYVIDTTLKAYWQSIL